MTRTNTRGIARWTATSVLVATSALSLVATQLAQAAPGPFGMPEERAAPQFGRRTPFGNARMLARDITGNGGSFNGESYDYVIVGGGLAGLTVASRLSEDSDVSVLVIEAGQDIYGADQDTFLTPAANLYESAVGTDADWQWITTAQDGLEGRQAAWPRGKVLGGSSSVNGLYMVRASEIEHNAWGDLNDARDLWGWDNMLANMKKSEHFHPPTDSMQSAVPSLAYQESSHGTDGPIHTTWPAEGYPVLEAFLQASATEGTAISQDPDNGESWGTFVALSSINPDNGWQRSSSRTGYITGSVERRSNLDILTGNQVTRVLTSSNDNGTVTATGVQYATSSGAQVRNVTASREVILCGGAINSPMLLQHSGIGDAQQLEQVGIESVIDLPGVGHNVQDHLATAVVFEANGDADLPPSRVTGNAETDSFVNSAISYVNSATLYGEYTQTLLQNLRDEMPEVIANSNLRDEVKAAYNITYNAQINDVFAGPVGPVELLFAIGFGSIQVQVALQHPLSRGSILVNSADPWQAPTIDAGYLTRNIDLQMIREGVKLARRIGTNEAMAPYVGDETAPGNGVQSDDDWDQYVRLTGQTEYHPSSGASMLPREAGGVVDRNLLVYGTTNLRVIDSSVPPLAVSAHLMTVTYGLGEIGADIVRRARVDPDSLNPPADEEERDGSDNVAGPVSEGNGDSDSSRQTSGASRVIASSGLGCLALTAVVAFML